MGLIATGIHVWCVVVLEDWPGNTNSFDLSVEADERQSRHQCKSEDTCLDSWMKIVSKVLAMIKKPMHIFQL